MLTIFKWVAYNFAAELETVLERKSSEQFQLVPECHTHPEDQIRTCVIGLIACRNADLIFQARAWHPVVNGRAGRACMFQNT